MHWKCYKVGTRIVKIIKISNLELKSLSGFSRKFCLIIHTFDEKYYNLDCYVQNGYSYFFFGQLKMLIF